MRELRQVLGARGCRAPPPSVCRSAQLASVLASWARAFAVGDEDAHVAVVQDGRPARVSAVIDRRRRRHRPQAPKIAATVSEAPAARSRRACRLRGRVRRRPPQASDRPGQRRVASCSASRRRSGRRASVRRAQRSVRAVIRACSAGSAGGPWDRAGPALSQTRALRRERGSCSVALRWAAWWTCVGRGGSGVVRTATSCWSSASTSFVEIRIDRREHFFGVERKNARGP